VLIFDGKPLCLPQNVVESSLLSLSTEDMDATGEDQSAIMGVRTGSESQPYLDYEAALRPVDACGPRDCMEI